MFKNKRLLSVSELTTYLQDKIENDPRLSNLWLRGEVSNVKTSFSGHIYFTLKDENAVLKCVMFRSYAIRNKFELENGMQVIIRGNLGIYGVSGAYQLYVQEIQLEGIGSLQMAYEQLKNKLASEGLFDTIYKRELPFCPKKIGVITSKSGAVIKDIITVLSSRFPGIDLYLRPAAVQGEYASNQIVSALEYFNKKNNVEVIILARGGGSIEELWPFNSEEVARAIFKSQIPVVSAVGHETDYTIADFVSDLRAPTPSAAAEIVVPSIVDLQERINNFSLRMERAALTILKERIEQVKRSSKNLNTAMIHLVNDKANLFASAVRTLNSLSPLKVLERGYAVCLNQEGDIIKNTSQVSTGENVKVILAKGSLFCYVDKKEEI